MECLYATLDEGETRAQALRRENHSLRRENEVLRRYISRACESPTAGSVDIDDNITPTWLPYSTGPHSSTALCSPERPATGEKSMSTDSRTALLEALATVSVDDSLSMLCRLRSGESWETVAKSGSHAETDESVASEFQRPAMPTGYPPISSDIIMDGWNFRSLPLTCPSDMSAFHGISTVPNQADPTFWTI